MKKILALILVFSLLASLAACANVTKISVSDPAGLQVEKKGGSVAVTLTDAKTVQNITNVICQIPLEKAEDNGEDWNYRVTWLDADGDRISRVEIAGSMIRWNGQAYKFSIGVDLSVLTNALESIPGLNK